MTWPRSSEAALPRFQTARVVVRAAQVADAIMLADFFLRNRDHFKRWDPPAPRKRFTARYWQGQLERAEDEWRHDRALRLHVFLRGDESRIVGRIGFSQIFRGPFQNCSLGYQLDQAIEGQGMMREALTPAIHYMFEEHGLHRVQAAHLEENVRSAALLARLGFVREGLAQNYLFIDGRWRDHVLNALTYPAFDDGRFIDS